MMPRSGDHSDDEKCNDYLERTVGSDSDRAGDSDISAFHI